MKSVLHITHTDIRSDSRILKEMGALASADYQLYGLGVAHDDGSKHSSITFKSKITIIKLLTRKLTFFPATLRHALSILELVFKMLPHVSTRKPDLIHCHDTLALPLGVIAKVLFKSKLIYDAHELESDRNGLTKLQGFLTSCVEKIAWKHIDGLIVVSPSIANWYDKNIGPKNTEVILNSPIFHGRTKNKSDYLRTRFNVPSQTKIFVYVGILSSGRGIELITRAFQDKDVSSHVVFLGYGELMDELKIISARHHNIHVHDAVEHSKVVDITQSSDFGLCLIENVSLSDYYCLPNKLFEYCFSGIPVLASDFPDIKDVVTRYNLGSNCELDLTSIKAAIMQLASSSEKPEFSDLKTLSWQAQEKKLIGFYENILTNGLEKN